MSSNTRASLALATALAAALSLPALAGPRIIHVPPSGESGRAAALSNNDDDTAPPARRRNIGPHVERRDTAISPPPRPKTFAPRIAAPNGPQRTVLSAPPLPLTGPSPIRPLPRWRDHDKITAATGNPSGGAAPDDPSIPK